MSTVPTALDEALLQRHSVIESPLHDCLQVHLRLVEKGSAALLRLRSDLA